MEKIFTLISWSLGILLTICYFYQFVYIVVGLINKPKKYLDAMPNKIAILIAARNEETVIGNLIMSIQNNDYPKDKYQIFVIADNCIDHTKQISESLDAKVYERNSLSKIGKGYALDELFSHIKEDYGDDYFDAYIVLDADNVLDKNYLKEMNKVFSSGEEIITSYRNSKNYGSNWISASYSLWFIRESRFLSFPRTLMNSSCVIGGTGFLISNRIIKENNGWHFFLLTEDIEFSSYSIIKGYKISYAYDAILYDEQPESFIVSWKQRLRWAKGFLQVFKKYSFGLFKGQFRKNSKNKFACFDMLMTISPAFIATILITLTLISEFIYILIVYGWDSSILLNDLLLKSFIYPMIFFYILLLIMGLITIISEWERIRATTFRKILSIFQFPLFILTYFFIAIHALFWKPKWHEIKHTKKVTIDDIK